MTPELQSVLALMVVAIALTGLAWNAAKRQKPGNHGGCGCPVDRFKQGLKR